MSMVMASIPPLAREAIEHARRRDFDKALATAQRALEQHADDMGLQLFVGLLFSQRMELDKALPHLRAAVALAPRDSAPRLELARTLIALGELDEAEQLLGGAMSALREGQKLGATVLLRRGEFTAAAQAFRALCDSDPRDFESWGDLGTALLGAGDAKAAADALDRSLRIRPDQPRRRDNWADAQVAAGNGEGALQSLRTRLAGDGANAGDRITTARLEELLGRPEPALAELKLAVEAEPANGEAWAALARLYERRNEDEELERAVAQLEAVSPGSDKLPLLRAQLAYRHKDFEGALRLAEAASPLIDPAARNQLIGQVRDRFGDSEGAWQAFEAMNREDSRITADVHEQGARYLETLEGRYRQLTKEWASNWSNPAHPHATPAFLVGFPRSGTTLLDTFLMASDDLSVSEENPMLLSVSAAAGGLDSLPKMDPHTVERLQRLYWSESDQFVPDRGNRLLLDKFPFGLVGAPYIHRLFPSAPIILALRHPCDVVLSCYFTRFQPTDAAANFVDLAATARLYDAMMRYWTRSQELLKLRVQAVRYERLIEDAAPELRSLAAFLGVAWTDDMVEHRAAARKRGFIKTPSYAQVAEPVYSRSVERWQRYRDHMEPALPILAPWAEKLGYTI
jgi:tetratricopeptide (TPR) repeat protein